MELKHNPTHNGRNVGVSLNRTILELKHHHSLDFFDDFKTLNRTILELKQVKGRLSIVSVFLFKSYHFGIETWFSVAGSTVTLALNRTILELKRPSTSSPPRTSQL